VKFQQWLFSTLTMLAIGCVCINVVEKDFVGFSFSVMFGGACLFRAVEIPRR